MVQAGFIMHQNVDVIERLRRSGCKGQRRISLLRVIEFENASAGIERIPFNTKSLHQRNVQVAQWHIITAVVTGIDVSAVLEAPPCYQNGEVSI